MTTTRLRKWILVTLGIAVLMQGAALAQTSEKGSASPPAADKSAASKPAGAKARPRKVLIYGACRGFVHDVIPTAAAAIRKLGEDSGAFEAEISDDPAVFKPASLARFDAVCLNNTTGDLLDDEESKQALLDFVRGGKGLIGIHAATDCSYQWTEYGELIGGYFDGHPWNEAVGIKVDERLHPLTAMFGGQTFETADEIYQFKEPYSRQRLRVLLSIDPKRTNMAQQGIKRQDGDFAVSWVHNYGLGRVFYCSLGHRKEIFSQPAILQHYLAGIRFALGDLWADATPSAQQGDDGWETLFNGKDLAGWVAKPGSWTAADGVLTRVGGGDIWSEQTFGDFVLEAEFKVDAKTNSGIFIRTADIRDCVQTGIEVQVLDSAGKKAADKHDCGAVYDCLAPRSNAVKPLGEWNQVRITCRGLRVQVWMNGADIIDMNLDQWTEAGKNPDGTPNKFRTAYKDMARCGRIGLQDHNSPVWYRNIRVKPLAE